MKKILSLFLVFVLLFSLSACKKTSTDQNKNTENKSTGTPVKLGMGVISSIGDATSAKGDTNGKSEMTTTAAAVYLDSEGKIVDCVIDTLDVTMSFSKKGKAIALSEPKSKYELGDSYGMVASGTTDKEWYKQVDSLTNLIKGKKLDEVKALVLENGDSSDDVISAGCTINIADFITAVVRAVENAKDGNAKSENDLKLALVASQTVANNADADVNGAIEITVDISAVALDKDKKVTDAAIDTVEGSVSYSNKGITKNKAENLLTKRQMGDDYGMVKSTLTDKEWYYQVDALITKIIGKTASEIPSLADENGIAIPEVAKAGCTINILTILKAVVKAAS